MLPDDLGYAALTKQGLETERVARMPISHSYTNNQIYLIYLVL